MVFRYATGTFNSLQYSISNFYMNWETKNLVVLSAGGGMSTHSSILAWRIPWTKESNGLQGHKESDRTEVT